MAHPTPLSWMGHTVQQNGILRYIDRENPFGEILGVRFIGPSGLIVTDCYCVDHWLICRSDGDVQCLEDREEALA